MSLPLLLPILRRNPTFAALLQQSVRCYGAKGYWNHEWSPGPVPKTEEERIAAAKKYNLIPEDYKNYPDDGTGFGDYPKLEVMSAESRDQHALWDFPEMTRNYGEPLHVDMDMYTADRLDANKRYPWPLSYALKWIIGVSFGFYLIVRFLSRYGMTGTYRMRRHDPFDETQKHYSFELVPIDDVD